MTRPALFAAICEREPFTSHPYPSRIEAEALARNWDELGACAAINGVHKHKTAQVRRHGGRNGCGYTILKETIQ